MEQNRPIPTERLRTVRGQVVERFSLDELRDLTFELGADWDQLPGNNKSAKTTELLELLNRRTQLPALLAQLQTLRPDDAWALDDLDESAESPYKGLEFYNEADAGLFFGRERLIGTLLGALRGQSFMAVVGASGSGKSSVVRAGVVPALKGLRSPPDGAALPKDGAGWAYLELTPTDRPLEQLALALTGDLNTAGETLAIIRDLRESPESAHLYIRKYLERQRKPRAFLLVDQFEELFTLCKDEPERAAFIDGLLAAAGGGATTVVLTLRADFYHHCLRYPGLRDALQQRQQLIGAMDEVELREAVERPALRTGYELEPGLADKIVRDAGDEAGALPLLSHALLETWKRREAWRLTHYGYSEAGGVGGAIARTAERAYGDLDEKQQRIARRIFLQLTELGEGAEDTRRRVALADLMPGDAAARSEAEAVLNALSQARLVSADDAAAQVSHEALIREWPALQEWLRDNREALRLERRLAAAAAEWDEGGRDPSYLYDGAQLAAARGWAVDNAASMTATARAFLDAATAEEELEAKEKEAARRQREKLTRRAFVGVSAFTALAMFAAVFALLQWNTASHSEAKAVAAQSTTAFEATRAEVNLNDSRARLLLNQSERVFESDPLLADRLLLEAALMAGSDQVTDEVAHKVANNLIQGRTVNPITDTVAALTGIYTNTVYVVDYLLGKDGLISGTTGASIAPLNGEFDYIPHRLDIPFFIVNYSDFPSELRRIDDGQVVQLTGDAETAYPIPDSPFFIVGYTDLPGELRRKDGGQVIKLKYEVYDVIDIPDSPFFVIRYYDAEGELRRADKEQIIQLSDLIDSVNPIPDSPFFVVAYIDAPDELRRTDGAQVIKLDHKVYDVIDIPDSPFFVIRYYDAEGELRRADNEQVIQLPDYIDSVTPIPDSPFFVVAYFDAPDELRRTDGREVILLEDDVTAVDPILDSSFYIVAYSAAPGELRRTDSEQVTPLAGRVADVIPIPDSPFYVVAYSAAPGELRQTDNEQVTPLAGEVAAVFPIPDSPFYVVAYFTAPGELRQTDNELVIPLAGVVDKVFHIPHSPFFVVDYSDVPKELRRMGTGEVVNDKSGERLAENAFILSADHEYYRVLFQGGTSEIAIGERSLVSLGLGVKQAFYFPETNNFIVLYTDGRVVYIDLNLIEAIGGADAAEKLADRSPEELVAFTCETLFADNPDWDEAKLQEYLAFLPEGEPRACRE
ncbi:MAG: ATP-binding protein [Candidatus Promineofilum sp.]|nr:ATP-binding protein [Promineifilum sp.]